MEIAVLQEQKATLEVSLQETREELIRQRNAFVGASVEFEKKFAQQDIQNNRLIEAEQLRSSYTDREAKEAQQLVTQLREQISDLDGQLAEVTMRANAEPVPSSEQLQVVDDLKTRVRELEIMNDGLERRAKNIKLRYKEGTLVKSFVMLDSIAFEPLIKPPIECGRKRIRQFTNSNVQVDPRRRSYCKRERAATR